MAQREDNLNTKINRELKQLLDKKGIAADKIVVFGSYARGTEKVDSDIDLIIVSKNFRDKSIFERVELTTGIGRRLVKAFKKPFDLMFYSDLEWKDGRSTVIDAAKREGSILHG
ncbi:MAG: nucleotidyltransferase domain-containing protein [bacterium]|nr:nucleotidyltransferase domain-containing protein [bacterium]